MKRLGMLALLWWRFKKEARMVWAMLRSPATPAISKVVAILALVYLISPIDLVPDAIPVLGWIDDGVVIAAFLWLAYRFLPRELYEELRRRTGQPADGSVIDGEAQRIR